MPPPTWASSRRAANPRRHGIQGLGTGSPHQPIPAPSPPGGARAPPRPPLPAPHPPPCRPAAPPPTLLPTAKCRKQVGPAGGGGPGRRRAGAPRPGSCAGREGRSWRNPGQGPDAPCGLQEDRRGSAGRPASPGGLRRRGGGGAGTLVRGEMAAETAGPALAALPAPAPFPGSTPCATAVVIS